MQRKGPVDHDWANVGKQESKTRAISGEEAVNMMVICVSVCSWIVERTPDAGGAFGRLSLENVNLMLCFTLALIWI